MSLYAVEINEPYQVAVESKFRCFLSVSEDEEHRQGWTSRAHRLFATPHKEAAEKIAGLLAESWDAAVVPVADGEGVVFGNDVVHDVVAAFEARARVAAKNLRTIRG